MKTIIGVLLVGLLGFLGCSDGGGGTTTVGEATPVAPFGVTDTPSPTYKWTPVPWATKYRLLVQDKSETAVIEEWYTAEEGECASEDGLCMVTPDIEVYGTNMWKIQACTNEDCGLWSEDLQFNFLNAKRPPRFTDNGDGTVLDNDTGLVWTKSAAGKDGTLHTWPRTEQYCMTLATAGGGWRTPLLSELYSLIDEDLIGYKSVAIPWGHPFERTRGGRYFTVKRWFDHSKCTKSTSDDGSVVWLHRMDHLRERVRATLDMSSAQVRECDIPDCQIEREYICDNHECVLYPPSRCPPCKCRWWNEELESYVWCNR